MSIEPTNRIEAAAETVPLEGEKWNFHVLLGQGICVDAATYLASPRLVIPFLYFAAGAPVIFAGLLLPLVQFARLVTQLVAAPFVKAAKTRKWFIMMGMLASATALSIIALATRARSMFLVVVIFMLVALAIGTIRGLNALAYNDLIGRSLQKPSRNTLIFTQTTVAGVITILMAWAAHHIANASTPLDHHLDLLWGGVALMIFGGLLTAIIREPLSKDDGGHREVTRLIRGTENDGYLETLRSGLDEVAHVPWFRSYMITRGLLVSVELAMPFYSIHAASLYVHQRLSLSIFVVAVSLAVIIGGPTWQLLGRISERYVMALGAVFAACAGVWALIIHMTPSLQDPIPHGLVFAFVALGAQGVVGARRVLFVNLTPDEKRPYYVALSNTIASVIGILFAFVFGSLAHLQGTVWPIFAIVGLNVLAAISCLRLTETAEN